MMLSEEHEQCSTPYDEADIVRQTMDGIASTPQVPEVVIIRIEPEPLAASGQKYVAYLQDGTPLFMASESLSALQARVKRSRPVKEFRND